MTKTAAKTERRVGYVRASLSGLNLGAQIEALRGAGLPSERIFVDRMGGVASARPGLQAALQIAQEENAACFVWSLDRLGRSVLGVIGTIALFESRGVRLISLTEGFDLATPAGQEMVRLLKSFADVERETIKERGVAGVRRRAARGEIRGRPIAMTQERVGLTLTMLGKGAHVVSEILPALQRLEGPTINKSRLYAWIGEQRLLESPADPTDDH